MALYALPFHLPIPYISAFALPLRAATAISERLHKARTDYTYLHAPL